jgi:acyl-coenzyme A synthetase/AMP-(fatty) acid ligase
MKGIFEFFHESAARYPDKPFIQITERVWTYAETINLAIRVSQTMHERGVKKGDRILIFCDNSIQYVAAFFGTLRLAAVAVPVNPAKMTQSILYIIEKCTPRLILACDATAERLDRLDGGVTPESINVDRLDAFDQTCHTSSFNDAQAVLVDENDVAVILFTSGTTANPKGVTLTHGNLIANTEAVADYLKLTCDDSMLMTLPFSYAYGNSVLLTHALAGALIIIENAATFPFRVLEGIKKYGVSGFSTVGSYANLMLKCIRNSESNESYLESLRYMTFAGEATNNDDICFIGTNFPYIDVYLMYGQTEASARLSYLPPEMLASKLGSIGKGLRNVELKVVNDQGIAVRPGEQGEIIARGPNVMKGYWRDLQATEDVLRDGWLFTGDTATVDEDGYIYIKGRKSDIIKHMGHRISPAEIEQVINSCGYIKECAVVECVVDRIPVIKAFIVPNKECRIDDVKRVTYAQLPVYMRPHVYRVIDQLPKTESGKIQRSVLRRMECAESLDF